MKKQLIFFAVILSFPFFTRAQAHIGSTESEILNLHPDNTFKSGVSNAGERYIYSDMPLGTFYYYISNSSYKTHACRQYPYNLEDLNAQVQIYNGKYVITSKASWTAYLDGGGIMYIKLLYSDTTSRYYFAYADSESDAN